MKKTILAVCFDETVGASRRAALEEAGYTVIITTRVEDALQMLTSVVFNMVIVGHRFSTSDKRRLATEARKKDARVVLLCGASADLDIPADARVYALEGTAGLLSTVAGLLEERTAIAAAQTA